MHATRLTLAASLVLSASVTFAQSIDAVYTKSGAKPVRGQISKIDRNGLTVSDKIRGDTLVPSTDVAYVQWAGEPLKMKTGRSAEAKGEFAAAAAAYTEALGEASTNVKSDLEFLLARLDAKLAETDASKLDGAIAKLQAYRAANGSFFRDYEALGLLGEAQLAKGDLAGANGSFDELQKAPTKEVQMAARNAKARVLLARDDVAGALAAYQAVVAEKPSNPVEASRRFEALLGQADCQRRSDQYAEAVKSVKAVVKQVPESETRILARAYLLEGDCYLATDRPKDALFAYLYVDLLFQSEPSVHAEALSQLVKLWQLDGKPERSAESLTTLKTRYPNSPFAKGAGG